MLELALSFDSAIYGLLATLSVIIGLVFGLGGGLFVIACLDPEWMEAMIDSGNNTNN